jgi:uncharacterized membrane protein
MKIRSTCPLPTEVPLGLGIAMGAIALMVGAWYSMSWIDTNIIQLIVPVITAFMDAAEWIIISLCVACLTAIFGSALEGENIKNNRVKIITLSFFIGLVAGSFISMLVTGCARYIVTPPTCSYMPTMDGFIHAFVPLEGGFLIGWLGSWTKRCVKIERD